MKRIIMIVTLLCVMASVSAQRTGFEDAVNNLVYTRESREDVQERLQQIAEQMASREAKVETVRLSDDEEGNAFWTDGRVCYYLHSSHDGKRGAQVVLEPFDTEIGHTLVFTPNRQGTLLLQGNGYSLQCARAGKWQMLIVRNQQGRAVRHRGTSTVSRSPTHGGICMMRMTASTRQQREITSFSDRASVMMSRLTTETRGVFSVYL